MGNIGEAGVNERAGAHPAARQGGGGAGSGRVGTRSRPVRRAHDACRPHDEIQPIIHAPSPEPQRKQASLLARTRHEKGAGLLPAPDDEIAYSAEQLAVRSDELAACELVACEEVRQGALVVLALHARLGVDDSLAIE